LLIQQKGRNHDTDAKPDFRIYRSMQLAGFGRRRRTSFTISTYRFFPCAIACTWPA
jgi:hypothetical protein